MKLLLTLVLLGLLPMHGESQKSVLTQALLDEEKNHFIDASQAYQGLNKRGSRESALRAASNLYKARRYEEALPYYQYSDSLAIINDPNELFGYFECLKSLKKYSEADQLVRTHLKQYGNLREFKLQSDQLAYYEKLLAFSGAKVEGLPINTRFSEISPVIYNDWLYFVSTRPMTGNKEVHRINMQPFYNAYTVPVGSDMAEYIRPLGDFGKPEKVIKYKSYNSPSLPDGINKRYHDGPIYVTPSGDKLFFTSNWSETERPKEKKHFTLSIYVCEKSGNTWSQPKSFTHNSFEYSNQHAFYDEKTSTMYFSSNMPGGHGGYDIWKSVLKDGSWSQPVNLGDGVNTPKSEVFPSLTPDGKLIFSSNGWPGLGGLDLFMVENSTLSPLNMMAGLNSEMDDFGMMFTGPTSGYLSSSRSGGKGDDDIYAFTLDLKKVVSLMAPPKRAVGATLKDANTGIGVEGVKVSISGNFNKEYVTGRDGSFMDSISYDMFNPANPEVLVRMEKPGYVVKDLRISNWIEGQPLFESAVSFSKIPAMTETQNEATTSNVKTPGSLTKTSSEAGNAAPNLNQTTSSTGSSGNTSVKRGETTDKSAPVTSKGKTSGAGIGTSVAGTNANTNSGAPAGSGSGTNATSGAAASSNNLASNAGTSGVSESTAGSAKSGNQSLGNDQLVQVRTDGKSRFVIYFDFDKFSIRNDATEILAKVAYVLLEEYQAAEVLLTGHTDTRGDAGYNQMLSKKRVESAKGWLIDRGIDPKRIKTEYHGELKLAVLCADPFKREQNLDKCLSRSEHQLNRRVELEILGILQDK